YTNSKLDTAHMESREQLLNQAKVLLAGNVAETLILGSCSYKFKADERQKALEIIKSIVFGGLKMDELSKKVKNDFLDQAFELLKECEQEVLQLLTDNKELLQAITQELQAKQTL